MRDLSTEHIDSSTAATVPLAAPSPPSQPASPRALAELSAAPSSPMAQAARRFEDLSSPAQRQGLLRLVGALFVVAGAIYLPWLIGSLNRGIPWLAWPFLAANLLTLFTTCLSIFNNWRRAIPDRHPLPSGAEPLVGVIVPCCGEPVSMIMRTIASIFEQDWPLERMIVMVSDDGRDPELEGALRGLPVVYHHPPDRFAPGRDGAAKAGNLNSALAALVARYPDVRYVETRDCDDELGSLRFLREVVGELEHDPRLAYVQTIKETQVSAGDPFNNRESMFYRGQMLARNAANAVFPCGSGLVWRRSALESIGDFPTWNLVEDLQSGVEALRRGWGSCYLPIVGAVGQHSPEDVPNVYKQRGTWAIDTVRLMIWGDLEGLSLRQRAMFGELLFYYLQAFSVLAYVPCIIGALLGYVPFTSSGHGFLVHMLPLVLANEAWLLAVNRPYNDRRGRQRQPIRELWRVRIIWSGLAPVFMKASIQAILGGPHRKPVYKVTRKHNDPRWHWGHTLPQSAVLALVVGSLVYTLAHNSLPPAAVLIPFVYWGGLYVALFAAFVVRGWHGVQRARRLALPSLRPGHSRRAPS